MKHKIKLAVILAVEFIAIAVVLVLIFISGKKQFTVTFDLDGGILVSGSLEQSVSQGHSATPPVAVKEGHYLKGWSGNYKGVTHDSVVTAIWEYVTTPGIEYLMKEGATYTQISGCYKYLEGKVYIGAYKDDLIVLGIMDGAFQDCTQVTEIYLLDGILNIGEAAFANCRALTYIELPDTVTAIGEEAFAGCRSLKSITLPRDLEVLGRDAFAGCTSLEEVYIPHTVKEIAPGAFEGLTSLTKVVFYENPKQPFDTESDTETEEVSMTDTDTESDTADETETEAEGTETETEALVDMLKDALLIGERAFADCTSLEAVVFADVPLAIDREAFDGCTSLRYIILPQDLVAVGAGAFNTEGLEIYMVCESEDAISAWLEDGWYGEGVTVIYGYTEGMETETETDTDTDTDIDTDTNTDTSADTDTESDTAEA